MVGRPTREAEGEEGQALGFRVRRIGSMANPPGRLRCSWEAGGVGPLCLPRGQGEDGTVRRRLTEDRWNPEARELVTTVPWRMSEDDDKADGKQFAKLQVPEEAIHKHDEDVERERDGPRVDAKKLLQHKEGHGLGSAQDVGRSSVGPPARRTPRRVGRDSGKLSRAPRSTRGLRRSSSGMWPGRYRTR